jgi:hypothetical protein
VESKGEAVEEIEKEKVELLSDRTLATSYPEAGSRVRSILNLGARWTRASGCDWTLCWFDWCIWSQVG